MWAHCLVLSNRIYLDKKTLLLMMLHGSDLQESQCVKKKKSQEDCVSEFNASNHALDFHKRTQMFIIRKEAWTRGTFVKSRASPIAVSAQIEMHTSQEFRSINFSKDSHGSLYITIPDEAPSAWISTCTGAALLPSPAKFYHIFEQPQITWGRDS